ncbi:MAG: MFS transporter [Bacteroidetes bacterium]|nr:MAG: MFS transporter [Bacteroidota bacterium]
MAKTVADGPGFQNQAQLFGHPVGLYFLFFTELWERFSYYGMRALFTLFLVAEATGPNAGFGWSEQDAYWLYGWYTMLVYVASIPGGILADKFIGRRRSVMLGGVLLCIGHSVLALNSEISFYIGCLFVILGVGSLKPNISSMVGDLYGKKDDRRDKAFYIFYIGINIGAFLAPLICGYVGEKINWHYGFGLAAIGMFLGQVVFIWGQRYLKGVGDPPKKEARKSSTPSAPNPFVQLLNSPLPLAITAVLVGLSVFLGIFYLEFDKQIDHYAYTLLFSFLSLCVGLGMVIYRGLNRVEKDRVMVLLLSFIIVIVFWGAFEQAGGLMNVYAKQKTDRLVSLFTLDLMFGAGILFMLIMGFLAQRKQKPTFKYWYLGGGVLLTVFLILRFALFTEDPWEVPASIFQSVNAFFIFTLATMVGSFWYNWKMKGRESSSIFKMALGVIIMGWGFFFMVAAAAQYEATGSSAMYWLILAYLFHTLGELCASPVALSFITKLAPVQYASIMMGVYFAATGLGNKVAGLVGEASTKFGEYAIFVGIAVFCTLFGLLVLAFLKPLKRLTHGAEDLGTEEEEAEEVAG